VSSPKATRPVASSTHGDANGRAPKNGEKAPKNGEKKVLRKRALSAEV